MRTSIVGPRSRGLVLTLCFSSCCLLATALPAQPPATAPPAEAPAARAFQILEPISHLSLIELDSKVIALQNRIKVVDGFDQNIINVTAIDPHQLRLHAESPGVTTINLTDEFGNVYQVEVFVEGDIRELQAYLQRLFPGSAIEAVKLRDSIVLRGWVTEPDQIPQVIAVATQFTPQVHNQLRVAGENLVQLNVKVMEVQRSKLQELGFNWFLVSQQSYVASTPGSLVPISNVTLPFGGPPAVTVNTKSLANPSLQFAITGASDIFSGYVEALQRKSLLKILAEPKLVTTSGRPASLLSGGEFPILVPQGLGTATINWKQFGVSMEAVPIVLGNGRLRLDISPEVSERDFSNAVEVNGFLVPGLTTRRVNTQVEMRFGDTLMIGGLIANRKTATKSEVPILGELPGIGPFFRRESYDYGETELLVLVTPHLASPMAPHQLPPGGPGMNSADPTPHEFYYDGYLEVDQVGYYCDPQQQGLVTPAQGTAPAASPAMSPQSAPPVAPPPPAESARRPSFKPVFEVPAPAEEESEELFESDGPPGLIGPGDRQAAARPQLLRPIERN